MRMMGKCREMINIAMLAVMRFALGSRLLFAAMLITLGGAMSFADNGALLHQAVAARDSDQVAVLLQSQQENLEARDMQARTPLMVATQQNDPATAKVLIEAGADVNAKNGIQDTPYLLAGAEGYNEILQLTLANGANIQDTNRYGGTAIIPAAEKGHLETINILLNAGLDPNHINNLGWTALMEAVILGDGSALYVEIVKTLIAGGADPNIPDKKGVTALSHAKSRGDQAMIALLQANGGK